MPTKEVDAILLFGDSITQGAWEEGGFAQRLAYVYARKLDVINRGLSGYNSEWALPVFEQVVPKKGAIGPKIKLLTIWLGANDACLLPSPQHLSLDRFIANLRQMVSMVQSPDSEYYSPETRIILITPPPFSEAARAADLAARDPPMALDRKSEVTKKFADAVIELGKELDVPVVDVYTPIWKATDNGDPKKLGKYLYDGLHLSREGYAVMYELLIQTIKTKFPELHYDALPMVFPGWKDLDWSNARASIF
ncbi:hypothetical protein FRC04_011126 [Tulasnella sp. 424]|nr:hypothetical protein FRC04_011126 [Tulasnella sp. 424]KAG8978440.1 hypothetical protein FRC05_010685 [Tulasnella sp. 425]